MSITYIESQLASLSYFSQNKIFNITNLMRHNTSWSLETLNNLLTIRSQTRSYLEEIFIYKARQQFQNISHVAFILTALAASAWSLTNAIQQWWEFSLSGHLVGERRKQYWDSGSPGQCYGLSVWYSCPLSMFIHLQNYRNYKFPLPLKLYASKIWGNKSAFLK